MRNCKNVKQKLKIHKKYTRNASSKFSFGNAPSFRFAVFAVRQISFGNYTGIVQINTILGRFCMFLHFGCVLFSTWKSNFQFR